MSHFTLNNGLSRQAEASAIPGAFGRLPPVAEETGAPSMGMAPAWVLMLILSVPTFAILFWWIGTEFFRSDLNLLEYLEFAVLIAAILTGGYQLYFWVQRHNYRYATRCFKIDLDDRIPFWPQWIWIYNLLYYVMIGLTVVSIESLQEGVHLIFGGLMLLLSGTAVFYFFPTEVPASFRDFQVSGLATRYIRFVQSFDNSRNAFPSMHCAVAAYVGLILIDLPFLGPLVGYGFIVLLTVSCLVVKQHVIVDTLTGIALGFVVFHVNNRLGEIYLGLL